ncbi:hypothetical protein F0562_007439 [Nyssa sinensis]|uniref:Uncharacterized protein n=1 Tax=Nyssa sinensis TaxID=561372 RepID=A0A5J5A5V8_9ASTE|nr:hypothetical protein F0562_007439 [Nyssa sinensis]
MPASNPYRDVPTVAGHPQNKENLVFLLWRIGKARNMAIFHYKQLDPLLIFLPLNSMLLWIWVLLYPSHTQL